MVDLIDSRAVSPPAVKSAIIPRSFILTTSAPDTTGIVAGISGFLASHNALITEAQHYDDPYGNTSFMRTVFHDNGKGMPAMEALDEKFGASVGKQFNMTWHFHEVQRKCRVLLAVSRHGHCLNSILHRWSTGTLPIEVVAVVSNHQDMRSLAEWHGVPYHYLPIIDGRKAEQEKRMFELFEGSDSKADGARPLHADFDSRGVPLLRGARHQHSPFLPARLQGREGVSTGFHARREADRCHCSLCNHGPG